MKLPAEQLVFAAIVCLCGLELSHSQTPIPAKPLGYTYLSPAGGQSPEVVLEVFYDHLCDDSKANWVVMKEVIQHFTGKPVTVIIHIFPLPYHHNAFFAQQVGVVVTQQDPQSFKEYIQLMFDNQDMFLASAANMTEPEVQRSLAKLAASKLGMDEQKILSGFQDMVISEKSRYAWKYGAYRGITGTPQFIVNGVGAPELQGYESADQWDQFITKLLSAPY